MLSVKLLFVVYNLKRIEYLSRFKIFHFHSL